MLTAITVAPARAHARAVPAPTLPNPSIATEAPLSERPRWARALGGALDTVPRGEVVHAHPVVAQRPERKLGCPVLDEIGGLRPHVRAREEALTKRFQGQLVGGQHGLAIAAAKSNPRLRSRIRDAACRELPRHRSCKPGDLFSVDIRKHPRTAGRNGEDLRVDDHDRLEAGLVVAKIQDAGRRPHGASSAASVAIKASATTFIGLPEA